MRQRIAAQASGIPPIEGWTAARGDRVGFFDRQAASGKFLTAKIVRTRAAVWTPLPGDELASKTDRCGQTPHAAAAQTGSPRIRNIKTGKNVLALHHHFVLPLELSIPASVPLCFWCDFSVPDHLSCPFRLPYASGRARQGLCGRARPAPTTKLYCCVLAILVSQITKVFGVFAPVCRTSPSLGFGG